MKFLLPLLAALFVAVAQAETLTFITLTGAGSLSDTAVRQAAPAIEKHTGKKVVVVNMPGANGLIGLRHFTSQPNDGRTVLVGNSSLSYLLATGQTDTQLKPLAGLAKTDMAVYTHLGFSSLSTLSASTELKAGASSPMMELGIKLFDEKNKTRTTVVGYKQFSQAVVDLAAQRIDYIIAPSGVSAIEGMVAAGRIQTVENLGYQFSWNAFFGLASSDELSRQLLVAVRETTFTGVQSFAVGPNKITSIQRAEAGLMGSLIETPKAKQP
jgi:tripartite-type tricarboxylate transporter receptor subunit TctC